jgi:hypothetical protein
VGAFSLITKGDFYIIADSEFPHRTVLSHVEPVVRPQQPYQTVGVEDLLSIWDRDRDVQRLLGYSA